MIFCSLFILSIMEPPHKVDKKSLQLREILDFGEHLESYWISGDKENLYDSGALNCKEIPNNLAIHSSYFKCNPYFMRCLLKNKIKRINQKIYKYPFKKMSVKEKKISLSFIYNEEEIHFSFPLHCQTSYLPQKVYKKGIKTSQENLWDNFDQDIFIDKYYTTFADLSFYMDKILYSQEIEISEYHKPATTLSEDQKKQYCSLRGGHLLQSHVFDAATHFPTELSLQVIEHYPLHFTKKRVFDFDAESMEAKFCENMYVKECSKKLPYVYHSPYGASWMGIYHSLGSYQEVLHDTFNGNLVIKQSSRDHELTHLSHEVGKRGSLSRFTKGAFRCMYYAL